MLIFTEKDGPQIKVKTLTIAKQLESYQNHKKVGCHLVITMLALIIPFTNG